MARLCCDSRQQVRTQSLTLLQRSLLVQDLQVNIKIKLFLLMMTHVVYQVLSPSQWEFAFLRVLFPMLRKLLEMSGGKTDPSREETKLRAAMMLSKVFLQHLTPLSSLTTFPALWLSILDMVGQFCATASTDLLADALPESLKNMLLVMDTSRGLFFTDSGQPTPLWGVTWGKIDTFMPGLRDELFPGWERRGQVSQNTGQEKQETAVSDVAPTTTTATTTDVVQSEAVASPTVLQSTDQAAVISAPDVVPSSSQSQSVEESVAASLSSVSIVSPPPMSSPVAAPSLAGVVSNQPIRGSLTSLPGAAPPQSPMDPPVKPFTAFSLPTSPSHVPSPSMFTPITPAPVQVSPPPSLPLVTPRPLLPAHAPLPPSWRPQSPAQVSSGQHCSGDSSVNTAFSNPLLVNSAPQFMASLPQLVSTPPSSAEASAAPIVLASADVSSDAPAAEQPNPIEEV